MLTRYDSDGSSAEDHTRKREKEGSREIFGTSKKIARSPDKNDEDLINIIKQILLEKKITGVNFRDNLVKEGVEAFLKEGRRVEAKMTIIVMIKPKTETPFVENWEKYLEIMKARIKPRGTNKYIEDDVTAEERNVQADIRKIVKTQRIYINGEK
ncbi:hypothetical protein FQA39_LY14454 [Lamprigera yunnana]|nr:hypothetical protein FQA39_LY14454 [Lamprigera yunnana]